MLPSLDALRCFRIPAIGKKQCVPEWIMQYVRTIRHEPQSNLRCTDVSSVGDISQGEVVGTHETGCPNRNKP